MLTVRQAKCFRLELCKVVPRAAENSRGRVNPTSMNIPPLFLPIVLRHGTNMSKKSTIPDAWDDDWEAQADRADAEAESAKAENEVKVSKAERLAQHAETNKKIWESAYVLTQPCSSTDMLKVPQRSSRNLSLPSRA